MSFDGLRVNHAGLDTAAQDLYATVKEIDDRTQPARERAGPAAQRLGR